MKDKEAESDIGSIDFFSYYKELDRSGKTYSHRVSTV